MNDHILFTERHGNEEERVYVKSKVHPDNFRLTAVESSTAESKPIYAVVKKFFKEVFLPQGFPDSVHPDYIPYQIWDTVQAFASTIMGILTTHSIMKGVGVGESSASPLAAAITWILKDGTGMVGRIIFAWWNGTDLDRQCKKWRLVADILNDMAMGIELLIPYLSTYSTAILCTSTAMKSIVGVAGGATRAALTQHQALRDNLADVSAKDGSQETCVNLIASFLGIFILSCIHDGRYLMELYVILVIIHLYANYSAVKALRLNSFNEDRLALTVRNYLINLSVPDPEEINKKESILLLRNPTKDVCGFHIKAGVSFANVVEKNTISVKDIESLLKLLRHRKYIVLVSEKQRTIFICFTKDVQSSDILKAYFHAYICGLYSCMSLKLPNKLLMKAETIEISYPLMHLYLLYKKHPYVINNGIAVQSFCTTDAIILEEYETFKKKLCSSGWTLQTNLLSVNMWRLS